MIKRDMEKNAKRLSAKWMAVMTSLAVSASMTGCSLFVSNDAKQSDSSSVKEIKTRDVKEEQETLTKAVYSLAGVSSKGDAKTEKEETVYGMLHADGTVDHIIVNNWLKNFKQEDSLTVNSDLKDITNVNGKETFTEQTDGTITWAANGNDIYYQGNTEKELPVSMKVTYYLDDKEVKPEELKGKSGSVKIRYEYENLTKNTITVDGKNEIVCTPFLVVTGMILPTDTFSNIEAENAQIISDGSNQIVVSYALPGLQKSLGIKDKDLKDISEDFTIPDYFEVTADANDFSMNMTLTMATSSFFADSKEDMDSILEKLEDMSDDMDELQDGSTKLVDGSGDLHDGTKDLKDGAKELNDGVKDLKDGTKDLTNGAKKLNNGAKDLRDGSKELTDGAGDLKDGAKDLKNGAEDLKDGTKTLKEGLSTLNNKSKDLTKGIHSLKTGIDQYTGGVASLKEGADTLQAAYEGEKGAVAGAKALAEGTKTLDDTISNFSLDASGLDIQVDFDMDHLVDTSAIKEECTNAAQAYLQENQIDPKTEEGQAIIKAFTAGSSAGTTAVSSAIATAVSTQKDAITENVSTQIKKQIGETLEGTMTGLKTATKQLSEGASALSLGVEQLYGGTKQLSTGILQLYDNSAALIEGADSLKTGWSQYAAGVKSANQGAKTLFTGTKTLSDGTITLFDGTASLYKGAKKINDGTVTLKDGTKELYNGTRDLSDGVGELKDGTKELYDGSLDLNDGAKDLLDGMKELDKDGIQKLSDVLRDDMTRYADRMRGLLRIAKNYDSFTGSTEGMENSVKFILKTAEISNDKEE